MNFLKNIRISTAGWAIVIALVCVGVLFSGSSMITTNNISAVQKIWANLEESRSEKAAALSALRKEIGYGGMIHQFKNFVLRKDKGRIGIVNAKLGGAASAIARYRALGLNETEAKALDDIQIMLNSYTQALSLAAELAAKELSPGAIDKQVKIDDKAAILGLDRLDEEVSRIYGSTSSRLNKSQAVVALRKAMGFGGMIHNFKNLVLRHNHRDFELSLKNIDAANESISLYAQRSLSAAERQAIQDISGVISAYKAALTKIETLAEQGHTAASIDDVVRIDDAPALKGFDTLIREIAHENETDAVKVDVALALVASVAKTSALITLTIIVLLIAAALWLIRAQIINPIARITGIMNRLAAGNLELDVSTVNQKNEIGEMARAVEVFRNTAIEREKSDLALKESGERLGAVVDHIFDGIIIINQDGTIQSINPAAINMFGHPESDLVGKNINMLMPEPYHSAHDGYLSAYLSSGVSGIIGVGREVIGLRHNGVSFPLHLQIADLNLSAGRFFLGVVRDLTEQKEADRAKTEFVSTVSHELRTPLTSIKGSLGLVRSGAIGDIPEKLRSMIDIAYQNSDRLVLLINDILDMEKIKAGKMDYTMESIDLASLIEEAIEANKGYGDEHNVTFIKGAFDTDAQIHGDKGRLIQVLSNLMSNAAKFSPDGEQVEMSITRNNGTVRVAVKDHGPGIPETFRKSIFQQFSQADSSDIRTKGGTGLGLSITKVIVEHHGGSIGFDTKTGEGSTFFFDLPELEAEGQNVDIEVSWVGKHRILVCENESDTELPLEKILEDAGYITQTAKTAKQALHLLETEEFDALTFDPSFQEQNNIPLLEEIRKSPKTQNLPVIVISTSSEDGQHGMSGSAFGIVDWIEQPIETPLLINRLKKAVKAASGNKPRILHVEDDESILQVVAALIADSAEIVSATTLREARTLLTHDMFDLVILDLKLPDGEGEALLPLLNKAGHPSTPVIIFSAKDVSREITKSIKSVLVKSQTTNEMLLDTIRSTIESGSHTH